MLLPLNYKKLPVEDLIALMADKTQEQRLLDRAYSEFHDRFKNYVYKVCINTAAVKNIFIESELDIVAHNGLLRAYFNAHLFTPARDGTPESGKHKRICGWLGVMARHSALKYILDVQKLKNKIILTCNIDDYTDVVNSIEDCNEDLSPPSPESQQLEEAISKLSKRDWEITATYLTWEDEFGVIPLDILDRINERYGLLPKYAGKIANRTIEKLFKINPKLQINSHHGAKNAKIRRIQIRGETKKLPPFDGTDVPGDTGTG